jgi:hypothetical protein
MSVRTAALPFATALVIALAACGGSSGGPTGSPTMRPGEACLGCHDGQSATRYTAAGTVYTDSAGSAPAGHATVVIAGATRTVTLTTNAAGNFYTSDAFGFPATVTVTQQGGSALQMQNSLQHGDCNLCHDPHGPVAPQFRVH